MSGMWVRRLPRGIKAVALVVLLVAAGWWPTKLILIRTFGVSELHVGMNLVLQRLGWVSAASPMGPDLLMGDDQREAPTAIEIDESIVAFRQIGERLGPRALASNIFQPRGVAIFDANGDGRMDMYFTQSGRPVAKWSSPDNVLEPDKPVPAKPCALYLNMGNDAAGDPIYRSVQDLLAEAPADDSLQAQELVIENKYRPRSNVKEDEFGPGRIAAGVVAADFNGDGLMDLYVLNSHYGLLGQTHELGLRVYPAPSNLGRKARESREALVIRFPSFLWGEMEDGLVTTVELGPKPEPEGRNSLFLNLGDQDEDGIPEWQDVTDRTGVGGNWASVSGSVGDFDRDGDLDIYVSNFLDPDFWGFGTDRFAGNRNQLYVNQLAETGKLEFRNMAEEMGVAGLHDEENLESSMYFPAVGEMVDTSEHIVDGRQVGEKADHTWAAMFTDWSEDGWLDLVVANDVANRLRVYENLKGKGFRYLKEFDEAIWDGCWMGMSVGDLDGDHSQEIMITSCGGQTMSVRNNALFIEDWSEANIMALSVLNYISGHAVTHHALLSYDAEEGFKEMAPEVKVHHSPHIPPDQSNPANFSPDHLHIYEKYNYATSLTSYEFAFNAPMFDVDNDGDLDMYMAGSLSRGNDDFVGDWSGSPGRMLVNESTPGDLVFRDMTLEYQLLDMTDVDYSYNPPRRAAPGTNWHKRDYIYLTDTDGYAGMGIDASKSAIHDIFRMHEAAFGVYSSDLNEDGFEDLVVTHSGGYNSLSPDARNVKVNFAGRLLAVPAPNKVNKPPTGFEEGKTFVYINGGAPKGTDGNWVKIYLTDGEGHNRYAVGARVLVNDKLLRYTQVSAGAAFGATSDRKLNVGLGSEGLRSLEITWPSGSLEPQRLEIDPPVRNGSVCIDRQRGVVACPETLQAPLRQLTGLPSTPAAGEGMAGSAGS